MTRGTLPSGRVPWTVERAHLPIDGGANGMGDRPAVLSSVLSAIASATAEALAKEESSGEGWVLPMLPGARPRARPSLRRRLRRAGRPCYSAGQQCARPTPPTIGRCARAERRARIVFDFSRVTCRLPGSWCGTARVCGRLLHWLACRNRRQRFEPVPLSNVVARNSGKSLDVQPAPKLGSWEVTHA